jgi:hypothetical protein
MYDLLAAMVSPTACLNTTEAKNTVTLLSVVDPGEVVGSYRAPLHSFTA